MITVAIVEDHQILIDALELMLQRSKEFKFVGAASSLSDAYELVQRIKPDILLLDIQLPDGNGYDLVPKITSASPHTRVVVLTSYTDEDTVMRAVDYSVSGFLPKTASLTEFYKTIRKAADGEIVIPPQLLTSLLKQLPSQRSNMSKDGAILESLTPREAEILSCLAAGKSGVKIAEELKIAPLTVRTHVRNMMSKLGVHSRLEAVVFGVKHGLIDAYG